MKEHLVPGYLANLIVKKGGRIKLFQPGAERGIAGTREEIYAVDKAVTLTAEELHGIREHLVGGTRTGQTITEGGIRLRGFIAFLHKPDWFKEEDPAYPQRRGDFTDLTRKEK